MSDTLLISCPACGATNRVPQGKIEHGLEAICGRCKTPLPVQPVYTKPVTVTDATFKSQVEDSPLPVLLDIWAPWCPPCKVIAPVIDELAEEMAGRVRFAKLNADENPVTTVRFKAMSIPTLVLFKGGKEVDRLVGAQPKSEIVRRLERAIAAGATASR